MRQRRWIDRLLGGTRRDVIELLLRHDRTVQELADAVGVSANAIRGHLAALERDGLVTQRDTRRETGGKPATIYALSRGADELFPKAYAVLLEGLLSVLDETDGPERVRETLIEVGARAAVPTDGSASERIEAAAELLRSLGATVEVTRHDAVWRIQGFSCPFSALTANDSRVCELAESLVSQTTGGSVHEVCDRGPRSRCAFEVAFGGEPVG